MQNGSFLPKFRSNISVPSTRINWNILTLKMGRIGFIETSARNYYYGIHRSDLHCGGSLKPRTEVLVTVCSVQLRVSLPTLTLLLVSVRYLFQILANLEFFFSTNFIEIPQHEISRMSSPWDPKLIIRTDVGTRR